MQRRLGTLRCAIYTRKSTDEGLEQEFNSLDAQREACAAYVTSQRHEGWALIPEAYEDGGFSGGSMNRPALRQLMADVAAGKIDVIVVYKVDRLTRSLADFAKIVEILDAKGASFVSVTQAFNTTTSMGRLTLNVLLSFAQFEREVTSERIRDKIAASKAKGMWMGGNTPHGYTVVERKLVVVEKEAAEVRRMFALYIELSSLMRLRDRMAEEGIRSRIRPLSSGGSRGGCLMTRGAIQQILRNPIYRGNIAHKGQVYPGEHRAIVDEETWSTVQSLLDGAAAERRSRKNAKAPSLLAGLVIDGLGRSMSPSHAVKGSRRYRYYVTHVNTLGDDPAWRLPARDLERVVIDRLKRFLIDEQAIVERAPHEDARVIKQRLKVARDHAEGLEDESAGIQRKLLLALISTIHVDAGKVVITLKQEGLGLASTSRPISLDAQAVKIRAGKETRMIIAGEQPAPPPPIDSKLVQLIVDANRVQSRLLGGASVTDLARKQRTSPSRVSRLARLSWLAPDIIEAILDGRQPTKLDRRTLMEATSIPLDWAGQRAMFGLAV